MRVITGSARGMQLKAPKGMETRPTLDQVKEAAFSAIQFEVEGRRVLDLFAGSGQMGIEALSRGAKSAVFVDMGKEPCRIVRENLEKTKLIDRAQIFQRDSIAYLSACREKFDLIFLDPPYAKDLLENALKRISEIDILSDSGIIICERPADKTLTDDYPGCSVWREYRHGSAALTIFRKA
ncbi:MAG: 16S rRNA (guanine(966)-N(2))-methyltransferase RsmD [Clostridia bacterium]|nr:16S rRNA (guanine(966)-N(2))-methyltransferase RsmD [Clostridia bacterium]